MSAGNPKSGGWRKSSRREKHKGRADTGWFFRVPVAVLDSSNYKALSFKARALLLDLGAQYRGGNNGDLCASWSFIQQRGWKSKDTLRRALVELLAAGMIEQTRQGGLHCCSLYAVTWLAIDDCGGKLDVPATNVASGLWRKVDFSGAKAKTKNPPRTLGHTAPTAVVAAGSADTMDGVHCPDSRH